VRVIYAIPGIGTTKELFQAISVPGYEIKVLNWPEPKQEYTLGDYANEFLKQMDTSQPFSLMGVSFGGMLCAELATKIKADKVILISSCGNRNEFPTLLKLLKAVPVHRLVPDTITRFMAKSKRRFLGFERSFDPIFFKMIDSMPENYFRLCINYIITWNKTSSSPNLVHIHGTGDRLLTYRHIKNAHAVKNGSHTMVLNKATEINTILNTVFNER